MSVLSLLVLKMAPVASVGAGAATVGTIGKKLKVSRIGSAIEVGAKCVENLASAIFLTMGAFWLTGPSLLAASSLILAPVFVFSPLLLAFASYNAEKSGDHLLSEKLNRCDLYINTFSKSLNRVVYAVVALFGTWKTYQWMISQIKNS